MTRHRPINVAEAKATLSELLDRAAAGEEIIIAKAGKPYARLVALQGAAPRMPGGAEDWRVSDDIFAPLSEEELAIAEGAHTDAVGRSKPRRRRRQ
jgi:prevent-host-death family protein